MLLVLNEKSIARIHAAQAFDFSATPPEEPTEQQIEVRYLATWCQEHGVSVFDAEAMVVLAERAAKDQERTTHSSKEFETNNRIAEKSQEAFEKFASDCGFTTDWNGLYPTLVKDGRQIYLPYKD